MTTSTTRPVPERPRAALRPRVCRRTRLAAGSTLRSSRSWAATSIGTCASARQRHLPTCHRTWSNSAREWGRTCATCRPARSLIAIEPNPYMHARLRRAARRSGVELEIRSVVGERIDLPDASAEAVISSLVLCTVSDPAAVLAEIRRILRPGGRFSFAEHVAAKPRTPTRWSQRILRRPWAWVFEGCSCERDLTQPDRVGGLHERRHLPLPDPLTVPPVQHPHRRHGHRVTVRVGSVPAHPDNRPRPTARGRRCSRRWTNTSWSLAGAPLNPGPVHVRGGLPGVPVPVHRNSSGVRVSAQNGYAVLSVTASPA